MKQRRAPALLAGIFLLGLLLMGCTRGTGPHGWAAPFETDDFLVVATGKGHIDGLEGSDLDKAWRFPNDWEISEKAARKLTAIYTTPVSTTDAQGRDVVFIGDYNGYLYAFRPGDAGEGTTKPKAASLKLNGPVIGGIAFDSSTDTLYVSSGSRIFSVRAADMANRISNSDDTVKYAQLFETGGAIWSAPVYASGKVYFGSLDGNVYAVDGVTGNELWHYDSGHPVVSVTLLGGVLITSGFENQVVALDPASGTEKWTLETANWVWTHAAGDANDVYLADFDGNLYDVNLATGSVRWQFDVGHGTIRAGPILASGTIVVGTDSGWLIGVDTAGSSKRWEKEIGTSVQADLVAGAGSSVLIAPNGCVTPEGQTEKLYYTSVDARTGELETASGVC
ncbi:MAG TPA: PQQ-binding-like beta-propeller repeat protein [Dehalococcoidia bacterium]|nr:PQQ-binding-like beta-propeller repeat protein [Dehalococcoidia bacterium]